MAKKTKQKQELSRMEVKPGLTFVTFDDGTSQLISVTELSAEETEAFMGETETEDEDEDEDEEEDEKPTKKGKKEEPAPKGKGKKVVEDEDEDDEEDDDDEDSQEDEELTGETLAEMDFEEMEDLCDENDLDTDPDDFDEDEPEELRKAIAKELGLKLPKAEKKGKKK